ncbi:MAG: NADH-quinone oxidoreductase subunit A [Elusimicrobia bacterium]|nr:NADH-quinone oxidoreductase subunit A [Elusimicrobiota bacterium]
MSALALLGLGVNLLAVLALTGFFAAAGRLFGPAGRREGDADMPYETGLPPLAPAHEPMTALYHRFAVLFVVFDVDLAFLLPWALNRPAFDAAGLAAATVFTVLVLFMLAYFWRKGVLECS